MWFLGNMASGGLAGASSLVFVYSLDYARTRLANDAKSAKKGGGERQFNGLLDVYTKTMKTVCFAAFSSVLTCRMVLLDCTVDSSCPALVSSCTVDATSASSTA